MQKAGKLQIKKANSCFNFNEYNIFVKSKLPNSHFGFVIKDNIFPKSKCSQANIITVILLILLVLVAVIIVWNVVQPLIKKTSEKVGTEALTVSLTIDEVKLGGIDGLQVRVKRGAGEGDITSLKFVFYDEKGESVIVERTDKIPNEFETKIYNFDVTEVDIDVNKIGVAPVFEGGKSGMEIVALESKIKKNSKTNPGLSCLQILNGGGSTKDGIYWIDIDGSGGKEPFQVYCDMITDGGGWTLVFMCFPYGSSCYNNNRIGNSFPSLDDTDTTKFSDDIIRTLLNNGEKIARTQWWHTSKNTGEIWASGDLDDRDTQWNLFEDPTQWSSSSSSAGQRFKRKWGSDGEWTDWITSADLGCGGAVGGWSNYYGDSCTQSWFAGCEGGPAIGHDCGNPQDRADKLIVWVR